MKKVFIVEVEYNELPKNLSESAEVLYSTVLESLVEGMMESYKQCGSIQGDYKVSVKQL